MAIPIIGGASETLVGLRNSTLVPVRFRPTASMTSREWIKDKMQRGLKVVHIAKEEHEHDLGPAELFVLSDGAWELLVAVKEG